MAQMDPSTGISSLTDAFLRLDCFDDQPTTPIDITRTLLKGVLRTHKYYRDLDEYWEEFFRKRAVRKFTSESSDRKFAEILFKANFVSIGKVPFMRMTTSEAICTLWNLMEYAEAYAKAFAEARARADAEARARADAGASAEHAASLMDCGVYERCLLSLIHMFLELMVTEEEEEEVELQRKKRDEEARLVYAVAVSAYLDLVYLYLVGLIDRGGTKTYSPGSRVFSSTFVSIVLVLAFYVWFKSRDPASRRGYCRPGQTKIEARYKPPKESGNNNNIYLGLCATHEEAGIKQEIAQYYYGQHTGWLDFEDDPRLFCIPPTPSEQANLSTEQKRKWVTAQVKEVYEDIRRFKASIPHLGLNGPSEYHLPNPAVEQVEHDPSGAFDPDFRAEDMDPFEDIDAELWKFSLENFSVDPEATINLPQLLGAETQVVYHDNHVPKEVITMPIMCDNLGDGCSDVQPGPGTSWDSAVNNAVHGISSEVAVGGLASGGAARDIPQSTSCEVSPTLHPSRESPTTSEFFHQQSAPIAGLSNVVKQSVVHLCQPQSSTSDLQFAPKLVRCLEQQIEEKDRRIAEQDSLIQEHARTIVDLKREVERLRSNSQH